MKRRLEDFFVHLVVGAIIVALLGFSMWFHFAAPCSWHQFETARHMPARCWSHYINSR